MNVMVIISILVFGVDQGIKALVFSFLPYQSGQVIIPQFFELLHVHNFGAAWNLFSGNRLFLIMVTFFFLGMIYYLFIDQKKLTGLSKVTMGLLIGGVLGNLGDRIFRGYVVDYLAFQFGAYHFPVFNIADMCIVLAVALMIVETMRRKEA